MDVAGIGFTIPIIILGLVTLVFALRAKQESKLFGVVCGLAAIALGIAKIFMYAGRMDREGAVYLTLNYSLSALFFVMLLLAMYSARRRQRITTS